MAANVSSGSTPNNSMLPLKGDTNRHSLLRNAPTLNGEVF